MTFCKCLFAAAGLSLALAGYSAFAGEDEEKGRALLEKNKHAVVTLELVIKQKISMQGANSEENEEKAEITGTVIGADGLTVTALSSTDPSNIYKSMMPEGMENVQMETSVSDMRILLDDGTEIPSQIVLRDNELDLAFARPIEKPAKPLEFIDLANSSKPLLLDKLIAINKLGKVASRVYTVAFESVQAMVERPRTFYIPGTEPSNTGQGSPAFTLDGKVVGVYVLRTIKNTGGGSGRGMFGGNSNVLPILLPAADILEGAKQAPPFGAVPAEPKPEEKKPAGDKPSGEKPGDAAKDDANTVVIK